MLMCLQSDDTPDPRLQVYVEDLNLPLRPDLSFLTCHMPSFSGLSSTIRLPPSFTPSFVAESGEVCWPPFNQASRGTHASGFNAAALFHSPPQRGGA